MHWRLFVPQLILGAAVIGLLVWRVDLGEMREAVQNANYIWVLVALPLFLAANFIGAVRSSLSVKSMGGAPVVPLFETYLVAFMVNQLVPLRVGDILRVQVMSRRFGLGRAGVTSAVFVTETLFDGAAFTLLFLWALAFVGVPGVLLSLAWTLSGLIFLGIIVATLFARLELLDGWEERSVLRALPERPRALIGRLLPDALRGLALLGDFQLAVRAFLLTLLGWSLQAAMYWVFGQAFGLRISITDAVLVMMAAALIVSAHFIPTSIGVYEGTITGLLVLLGLSSGGALAYSLSAHLFLILFGIICGLVAMWRLKLSLHDIVVLGETRLQTREPAASGAASD